MKESEDNHYHPRSEPNANDIVRVGFRIVSTEGTIVCSCQDWQDSDWRTAERAPGTYVSACTVPRLFLNRLPYSVTVAADIPFREVLFIEEGALTFEMVDPSGVTGSWPAPAPGLVQGPSNWSTAQLSNN